MAPKREDRLASGRHMSELEALLWDLEVQERALRSVITVVVTFDRCPDAAAVSERVDVLTRRLPRLRDRVVEGPLPGTPPRWEADPQFEIGRHLVTARAARVVTVEELLRAAEPAASDPLDPTRPLWRMLHVQSPAGPGALIVKLHHSLTDGLGAMKLAAELFDLERHPPHGPDGPTVEQQGALSWLDRAREDLAFEAERSLDAARRMLAGLISAGRSAAGDPVPSAQSFLSTVQGILALVGAVSGPGAPVPVSRSARSKFGALTIPLADFRHAARRWNGTVNDVFLAGVVGGLREYHAKRGSFPPSLRLGVPVSTRAGGTSMDLHNQFAPILVRVPLQFENPVERIRLLHGLVMTGRQQPVLGLLEQAMGYLRPMPGFLRLVTAVVGATDVMASNVPGSPVDLYLGGAKVQQIVPFGPRGASALNVTLLSHVHQVHIGVNMDPAAFPDAGVLLDCLRAGFDETLA
jgi:diacylglycerol O-acyltransferase